MRKQATDIIFRRLVSDQNDTVELQRKLKNCSTIEGKAVVIKGYCDKNLHRNLDSRLGTTVLPNLLAQTSWTELAARIDEELCSIDSTSLM